MFRVVERSILFFWVLIIIVHVALGSVSIHSCWASSKVYHSFIFIWWKNALSFVCLDIDISIHFVLSLSMFTIEALVFSFVLVSYVIRDFLFYFIFNTHGCIQRIYISSLSARIEEFFFMIIHILHFKLRNDVYACFIYCGRSSLFSMRYGFDLTCTSYLIMVGDCS